MFVIDDLLLWIPLKGFKGILKEIGKLTEKEYQMQEKWEKLLQLRRDFRLGRLNEKEFYRRLSKIVKNNRKIKTDRKNIIQSTKL